MTLRAIPIEFKHLKTYATRKNLEKAISEEAGLYPEYDDRFIVIKTPEDRWTAIVSLDTSKGGYIGRYSFLKM